MCGSRTSSWIQSLWDYWREAGHQSLASFEIEACGEVSERRKTQAVTTGKEQELQIKETVVAGKGTHVESSLVEELRSTLLLLRQNWTLWMCRRQRIEASLQGQRSQTVADRMRGTDPPDWQGVWGTCNLATEEGTERRLTRKTGNPCASLTDCASTQSPPDQRVGVS